MKINIIPLCLSLLFLSLLIQYAEKIKISEASLDGIETAFDYIHPFSLFLVLISLALSLVVLAIDIRNIRKK